MPWKIGLGVRYLLVISFQSAQINSGQSDSRLWSAHHGIWFWWHTGAFDYITTSNNYTGLSEYRGPRKIEWFILFPYWTAMIGWTPYSDTPLCRVCPWTPNRNHRIIECFFDVLWFSIQAVKKWWSPWLVPQTYCSSWWGLLGTQHLWQLWFFSVNLIQTFAWIGNVCQLPMWSVRDSVSALIPPIQCNQPRSHHACCAAPWCDLVQCAAPPIENGRGMLANPNVPLDDELCPTACVGFNRRNHSLCAVIWASSPSSIANQNNESLSSNHI